MSKLKPETFVAVSQASATSANTSDFKTLTPPESAAAMLVSVETTSCRMSFDGNNPSASNGVLVPTTTGGPVVVPVVGIGGRGSKVIAVSTAAANSVVNVVWLS